MFVQNRYCPYFSGPIALMPPKTPTRRYPYSDATLKQRGDLLVENMERDSADFLTRNIDEADRENLHNMLQEFINLPDDVEGRGWMSAATEKKDNLATALRKSISAVRIIAEGTYGTVGKYRSFGFTGMHRLSDDALHRLARRVVRIGTELLSELAARGLTATMLSDLEALNQAFDDAMESVHDKTVEALQYTEARITKGNAIWTVMAGFALAGKGLFQDTDAVRYKHYVLED